MDAAIQANQIVSTGELPEQTLVQSLLTKTYELYKNVDDGVVADYIPILGQADPKQFGTCVVQTDGSIHTAGDFDHQFTIQSISKAFVYALLCQELGHEIIKERIGVNNTGLPFNSVMAIELNNGHPMNPMVNAGAIATTALAPGDTPVAKWKFIKDGLSLFAGHSLEIDIEVYESEAKTNQRNQGIARLLQSYGRIDVDPQDAVDIYTQQCSLLVSAKDLAIMGATLADGGVNPVTGVRVVDASICQDTLSVLAASGMYENSGEWLFEIGIPGKSGVSGGIVTIAPGKGSLGTYSAPLDNIGNSVRGQLVAKHLSKSLGLNVFASEPQRSNQRK